MKKSEIKAIIREEVKAILEKSTDNFDVFDCSNCSKVDGFIKYLKAKKIDYDYDKAQKELSFDSEWLDKKGWDLAKKIGLKMKHSYSGNIKGI